jgi:Ca2+-transporting ATPase
VITAGALFVYQYSVINGSDEALTRTMTFTVLIAANIFLTLINRSFYYSILTTLKYKNNMVLFIISITVAILGLIIFVKPLAAFFEFKTLNAPQLLTCIEIGFISVIWFEIVKLIRRIKTNAGRRMIR